MSAADASTSKAESSSKVEETHKEDEQPALGILEEDDEFEEFAVAGAYASVSSSPGYADEPRSGVADWDDSKTHLGDLRGTVTPGAAKSDGDKLWEDNWDDDDIEDDFSVQVISKFRCQLALNWQLLVQK